MRDLATAPRDEPNSRLRTAVKFRTHCGSGASTYHGVAQRQKEDCLDKYPREL